MRWRTLRTLWRRASFEDAMDDEMRFHLESRAADLVRRGLTPEQAARQARLEFGSIEKQKDEARAGIGLRAWDEVAGDLRYALRSFAHNKGFTAAAVVTLALGIGANAAIFNLLDALALRPLPVSQPGRLLQLMLGSRKDPTGAASFSYPMIQALDAERDIFAGVAGFSGFSLATGGRDALRQVHSAVVTGAFYDTLGLTPAAGRLLARADDRPDAPLVAVASFAYWQREYGGTPAAVGTTILVNGLPVELVGISPRGFSGANVGSVADLTIPASAIARLAPNAAPLLGKGNSWLRVLARLQPGISQEQGATRLAAAWPRIADSSIDPRWPAFRKEGVSGGIIRFAPGATGWTYLRQVYLKPLTVLMGAVSLVLLIACANVASLLLARASARRKEIAVRMAIGAGRARLVRQLLVESLTLALMGAACGVALAPAASRVLLGMISIGTSPIVFDLSPNWRIVGFAATIASSTSLLFGLAPALQATAWPAGAALREDERGGSARSRLLPSLVAVQVALSLVLLVGAGLFIRTLRNLQTLDPGFRAEGVLMVEFERGPGRLRATVLETVRALPGVVSASIATHTPLSGSTWSDPIAPSGQPVPERDNATFVGAAPGFFETLGIALVSGRGFTDQDTSGSPGVAVVNTRYAATYFPHGNPVGRRLTGMVNGTRRELEIVGVVGNPNADSLRGAPRPTVYVAYAQLTGAVPSTVVVRASGNLSELSAALRRTLQPLAPVTPLEALPLSDQVRDALARERLMAALASAFGALALALAAVGIYGLLAYAVARRRREIGIRMALGARRRGVVTLVLRGALVPVLAGIAFGAPAAWTASRSIESLLFDLKPTDPRALGAAVVLLIAVAYAAAWLPARRAARVDPMIALRSE